MFSIVIPVHNRNSTLHRALLSIQKQNFSSYEVVCVNDRSTDGSQRIPPGFDERFRMVNLTSCMGQHCARQEGVEHARGLYIVPMDSDDILLPGILWSLSREIHKFTWDILWFRAYYGDGTELEKWEWLLPKSAVVTDIAKYMNSEQLSWTLWCKAIKRQVYTDAMRLLPPDKRKSKMNVSVDVLHSILIYIRAKQIRYFDNLFGYYYFTDTPQSCTRKKNRKKDSRPVWKLAGDVYKKETGQRLAHNIHVH